MSENVEEEEDMQKGTVRVRPLRPSRASFQRSTLKPVLEIKELSSHSSCDVSLGKILDSNERNSFSSSYESSTSMASLSSKSFRSSLTGDSCSWVSSQYSPKSSMNSLWTSQSLSRSSNSSVGVSVATLNLEELREFEEPPRDIFQQGTSTSTDESQISMPGGLKDLQSHSSMPSLADFSYTSMYNSASTSKMPSLVDIVEEEGASGRFNFFNTGTSTNELGVLISGRPMAEILEDEGRVAGKTLDVLAPTMHLKKPQTKERWSFEQYPKKTRSYKASDAAPPMAVRRLGESVPRSDDAHHEESIAFHLDEPDDDDNLCSLDRPPQMVRRQLSRELSLTLSSPKTGNRFQLEHSNAEQKMAMPKRTLSIEQEDICEVQLKMPPPEPWSPDQYAKQVRSHEASDAAPPMAARRFGESEPRSDDAPHEGPISLHLDDPDEVGRNVLDSPPQEPSRQISNFRQLAWIPTDSRTGNRFELEDGISGQKMVVPERVVPVLDDG